MLSMLSIPAAPVLAGGIIGGLGMPELLIILAVVLIIFGPKQLPRIGRAIGSGFRELKDAATKMTEDEPDRPVSSQPPVERATGTVPASTPARTGTPGDAPKDGPPSSVSPGSTAV